MSEEKYVERNKAGKFVAGNKARTKAVDRARALGKKHKEYALGLATSATGRKALKALLRDNPKDFFKHTESIMPKENFETRETEIRVVFPDYMLSANDREAIKLQDSKTIEMKETDAGHFSKVPSVRETSSSESKQQAV